MPPCFGKQELRIAENAGERIVEFLEQDFSEGVGKRGVRRRGESGIANVRRKAAQEFADLFRRSGGGQIRLRVGDKLGRAGGDHGGEAGRRLPAAENDDGSESRESCYVSQRNSLSGKHLRRQTG